MWEDLFTKIPKNEIRDTLFGMGLHESAALCLIKVNGTGNSVLSGLLGLLPILATLGSLVGVLLLTFKENLKKSLLYGTFGWVFVSEW